MQWSETKAALSRRTKNRVLIWLIGGLVILGWGSFLFGIWASTHLPGMPMAMPFRPSEVLFGLLGPFLLFWLSPMAWQWTGDERGRAPVPRALAQGLALWAPWFLVRILPGMGLLKAMLEKSKIPGFLPLALGTAFAWGFGIFVLTGFAISTWEQRVASREKALSRAKEAQWGLLRGQMSPHVLLNSLGGLAELVREDPAGGLKGMRDLAEVYRKLLEMGEKPLVPLASERRLLERYLAVEQLRMGEGMRIEWDWEPALDEQPVIPLLLQPLVENAIKHGISAHRDGGQLRIQAARDEAGLRLAVENTGAPLAEARDQRPGVGLKNLEARLSLAYGEGATLVLGSRDEWTRAEIRIPRGAPCR